MKTIRASVWDGSGNVINNVPLVVMTQEDFTIIENFVGQQIIVNKDTASLFTTIENRLSNLQEQMNLDQKRIDLVRESIVLIGKQIKILTGRE